MLLFPLEGLLDEQACYDLLLQALHPDGLQCPQGHPLPADQKPHDRHRAPVLDYQCRECGAVYNVYTGTVLKGTRWPCATVVWMVRGFGQGTPTQHLAEELQVDRVHLLHRRHQVQDLLTAGLPPLCPAGSGDRSGRSLPKRRRERATALGPGRSAPTAGQ